MKELTENEMEEILPSDREILELLVSMGQMNKRVLKIYDRQQRLQEKDVCGSK